MAWYRLPRSGAPYFTAGAPPSGAVPIDGPDGEPTGEAAATTASGPPPDAPPSIHEVLAWVGDDLGRAHAALDEERHLDQPRAALVEQLLQTIEARTP